MKVPVPGAVSSLASIDSDLEPSALIKKTTAGSALPPPSAALARFQALVAAKTGPPPSIPAASSSTSRGLHPLVSAKESSRSTTTAGSALPSSGAPAVRTAADAAPPGGLASVGLRAGHRNAGAGTASAASTVAVSKPPSARRAAVAARANLDDSAYLFKTEEEEEDDGTDGTGALGVLEASPCGAGAEGVEPSAPAAGSRPPPRASPAVPASARAERRAAGVAFTLAAAPAPHASSSAATHAAAVPSPAPASAGQCDATRLVDGQCDATRVVDGCESDEDEGEEDTPSVTIGRLSIPTAAAAAGNGASRASSAFTPAAAAPVGIPRVDDDVLSPIESLPDPEDEGRGSMGRPAASEPSLDFAAARGHSHSLLRSLSASVEPGAGAPVATPAVESTFSTAPPASTTGAASVLTRAASRRMSTGTGLTISRPPLGIPEGSPCADGLPSARSAASSSASAAELELPNLDGRRQHPQVDVATPVLTGANWRAAAPPDTVDAAVATAFRNMTVAAPGSEARPRAHTLTSTASSGSRSAASFALPSPAFPLRGPSVASSSTAVSSLGGVPSSLSSVSSAALATGAAAASAAAGRRRSVGMRLNVADFGRARAESAPDAALPPLASPLADAAMLPPALSARAASSSGGLLLPGSPSGATGTGSVASKRRRSMRLSVARPDLALLGLPPAGSDEEEGSMGGASKRPASSRSMAASLRHPLDGPAQSQSRSGSFDSTWGDGGSAASAASCCGERTPALGEDTPAAGPTLSRLQLESRPSSSSSSSSSSSLASILALPCPLPSPATEKRLGSLAQLRLESPACVASESGAVKPVARRVSLALAPAQAAVSSAVSADAASVSVQAPAAVSSAATSSSTGSVSAFARMRSLRQSLGAAVPAQQLPSAVPASGVVGAGLTLSAGAPAPLARAPAATAVPSRARAGSSFPLTSPLPASLAPGAASAAFAAAPSPREGPSMIPDAPLPIMGPSLGSDISFFGRMGEDSLDDIYNPPDSEELLQGKQDGSVLLHSPSRSPSPVLSLGSPPHATADGRGAASVAGGKRASSRRRSSAGALAEQAPAPLTRAGRRASMSRGPSPTEGLASSAPVAALVPSLPAPSSPAAASPVPTRLAGIKRTRRKSAGSSYPQSVRALLAKAATEAGGWSAATSLYSDSEADSDGCNDGPSPHAHALPVPGPSPRRSLGSRSAAMSPLGRAILAAAAGAGIASAHHAPPQPTAAAAGLQPVLGCGVSPRRTPRSPLTARRNAMGSLPAAVAGEGAPSSGQSLFLLSLSQEDEDQSQSAPGTPQREQAASFSPLPPMSPPAAVGRRSLPPGSAGRPAPPSAMKRGTAVPARDPTRTPLPGELHMLTLQQQQTTRRGGTARRAGAVAAADEAVAVGAIRDAREAIGAAREALAGQGDTCARAALAAAGEQLAAAGTVTGAAFAMAIRLLVAGAQASTVASSSVSSSSSSSAASSQAHLLCELLVAVSDAERGTSAPIAAVNARNVRVNAARNAAAVHTPSEGALLFARGPVPALASHPATPQRHDFCSQASQLSQASVADGGALRRGASNGSAVEGAATPVRHRRKARAVRFCTFDFGAVDSAPAELSPPAPAAALPSTEVVASPLPPTRCVEDADGTEPGLLASLLSTALTAAAKLRAASPDGPSSLLRALLLGLRAVGSCPTLSAWRSVVAACMSSPLPDLVSPLPAGLSPCEAECAWWDTAAAARSHWAQLARLQQQGPPADSSFSAPSRTAPVPPLPYAERLHDALSSAARFHLRRAFNTHVYESGTEQAPPPAAAAPVAPGQGPSFASGGVGRGGGGIARGYIALAPGPGLSYNSDDLAAMVHRALSRLHDCRGLAAGLIAPHALTGEIPITHAPMGAGASSLSSSSAIYPPLLTLEQLVDRAPIPDLADALEFASAHGFLRYLLGHQAVIDCLTARRGNAWTWLGIYARMAQQFAPPRTPGWGEGEHPIAPPAGGAPRLGSSSGSASGSFSSYLAPLADLQGLAVALDGEAGVVDRLRDLCEARLDGHARALEAERARAGTNGRPRSSVGGGGGAGDDADAGSNSSASLGHKRPKKKARALSRLVPDGEVGAGAPVRRGGGGGGGLLMDEAAGSAMDVEGESGAPPLLHASFTSISPPRTSALFGLPARDAAGEGATRPTRGGAGGMGAMLFGSPVPAQREARPARLFGLDSPQQPASAGDRLSTSGSGAALNSSALSTALAAAAPAPAPAALTRLEALSQYADILLPQVGGGGGGPAAGLGRCVYPRLAVYACSDDARVVYYDGHAPAAPANIENAGAAGGGGRGNGPLDLSNMALELGLGAQDAAATADGVGGRQRFPRHSLATLPPSRALVDSVTPDGSPSLQSPSPPGSARSRASSGSGLSRTGASGSSSSGSAAKSRGGPKRVPRASLGSPAELQAAVAAAAAALSSPPSAFGEPSAGLSAAAGAAGSPIGSFGTRGPKASLSRRRSTGSVCGSTDFGSNTGSSSALGGLSLDFRPRPAGATGHMGLTLPPLPMPSFASSASSLLSSSTSSTARAAASALASYSVGKAAASSSRVSAASAAAAPTTTASRVRHAGASAGLPARPQHEDCPECCEPVSSGSALVVCCTGCGVWYHASCVGIQAEFWGPHERFTCFTCTA